MDTAGRGKSCRKRIGEKFVTLSCSCHDFVMDRGALRSLQSTATLRPTRGRRSTSDHLGGAKVLVAREGHMKLFISGLLMPALSLFSTHVVFLGVIGSAMAHDDAMSTRGPEVEPAKRRSVQILREGGAVDDYSFSFEVDGAERVGNKLMVHGTSAAGLCAVAAPIRIGHADRVIVTSSDREVHAARGVPAEQQIPMSRVGDQPADTSARSIDQLDTGGAIVDEHPVMGRDGAVPPRVATR